MKKLFIICLLFATTTCFAEIINPLKPIRVRIAFDIAAPKYDCESGIGICKPTLGAGRLGGDGRNAGGECYIEDGLLHVVILKEYITSALDKELSAARFYTLQQDVDVPQIWLEKMEIKQSYVIPAANYEIVKEKDFFLIRFTIN